MGAKAPTFFWPTLSTYISRRLLIEEREIEREREAHAVSVSSVTSVVSVVSVVESETGKNKIKEIKINIDLLCNILIISIVKQIGESNERL